MPGWIYAARSHWYLCMVRIRQQMISIHYDAFLAFLGSLHEMDDCYTFSVWRNGELNNITATIWNDNTFGEFSYALSLVSPSTRNNWFQSCPPLWYAFFSLTNYDNTTNKHNTDDTLQQLYCYYSTPPAPRADPVIRKVWRPARHYWTNICPNSRNFPVPRLPDRCAVDASISRSALPNPWKNTGNGRMATTNPSRANSWTSSRPSRELRSTRRKKSRSRPCKCSKNALENNTIQNIIENSDCCRWNPIGGVS